MNLTLLTFFPFLVAFIICVVATPISIYFLKRYKVLDDPDKHKHPAILHTKPIPRGGGIPMFVGVLFAIFIFLPITRVIGATIIAAAISLIVGILDDKFDISPYLRFFVNILCATFVVFMGANIPFITNPLGGILFFNNLSLPFLQGTFTFFPSLIAILWIVWVMNMLNWSKGVDGQMPGIVAISAIVIGMLSLRFSHLDQTSQEAAILSFIVAGASLGFLVFNFYPAKIFPGYGATAIYLILAVASILSGAKLATAILVMGVPMTDGLFTIGRRILSGRSPFWHDKKHLHHLLLNLGLGHRSIALFYWVVSAILGGLSLVLTSKGKFFAIAMLVILAGGTILFLHLLLKKTDESSV